MTVLLAGGLITLIVLAFLAWPFFQKDGNNETTDREIAIYQDQLTEVERDLARGVLTEDQAKAARTEIERRLLGAIRRRDAQSESTISRAGRLSVVAMLAAVPLATALLYLNLGTPEGPQASIASISPQRAQERVAANERHPELMAQIEDLEGRLATQPDAEGYALLARSYASIQRYEEALTAYQEANRLSEGQDARLAGEMAEIMVIANGGLVGDQPREIFRLIKEDFPDDPQATYYLALSRAQDGDTAGAAAELIALRDRSPLGAPWLPAVNGLLAEIAPDTPPSPTDEDRRFAGPTTDQIAAAQQMTSEQQSQMIEGMVAGLAERLEDDPDDLEGWKRLARAYEVLDRVEDAERAHREVIARDPGDPAANAFLSGQ